MTTKVALPNEPQFVFLERVLKELTASNELCCFAEYVGIEVLVYRESYILDIWEKFRMERLVRKLLQDIVI